MRVFKDGRIEEKIVGEMINIESGKLLYEDGVPTKNKKPPLYPSIELDGIVSTIRSHVGFIYLPGGINIEEFILKKIVPLLEQRDAANNYLAGYARLERKTSQFTAMKAKNSFEGNKQASSNIMHMKRAFFLNTDVANLDKDIGHNRFYWFVFPISVLIKNIQSFESPRFPPTTQFVSILFDSNNQLAMDNNTKLDSNITFKHFRVCQHLVTFNPLKHELQQELEEHNPEEGKEEETVSAEAQALIDEKKCPDCKRQFKNKGGLTRHMNTRVCIKKKEKMENKKKANEKIPCPYCQRVCIGEAGLTAHLRGCAQAQDPSVAKEIKEKRELEQFKKMSTKEKNARILELESYPEYMPQWNDVIYDETEGLALCSMRGAVFELIRFFGRWNIYKEDYDSGRVPLKVVDKPIYADDFRNIVIDNTLNPTFETLNVMRKKQWPNTAKFDQNEICSRCFTPLYEDIYVVLPYEKSLSGMAVCPTCMHYEPSIWCEDKRVADYVIVRVRHPNSVDEVIDKTTFNDKKKEVMKQSFTTKLFSDKYMGDTAVYIGYDPNNHLDFQYIGWTGRIYNYINYTNTSNKFYKSGPKDKLAQIAAEANIFPIRMIEYE